MQKISDPKQIKNLDFSRRKVAGILSYFKTDNDEKADFLLFGRVRILTHLLKAAGSTLLFSVVVQSTTETLNDGAKAPY